MVKTAEDEDPLGVITVLNLRTHAALKALQQVRNFLQKNCASRDQLTAFKEVLAYAACS